MTFSTTLSLKQLEREPLTPSDTYCLLARRTLAADFKMDGLSPAERARMMALRLVADRERFLVAHTLKRRLLAKLLNRAPAELEMAFGKGNKPLLAGGALHFNLSHSGNWVALIICRPAPVGIDIEHPSPHGGDLPVEMVLNPADRFEIEPIDATQRFYASWTLKEAMSKTDGRGLDRAFDGIRFEPTEKGDYRGEDSGCVWWARHMCLADGTHLAYASDTPLDPLHILVT